jgi:hypothetical protein
MDTCGNIKIPQKIKRYINLLKLGSKFKIEELDLESQKHLIVYNHLNIISKIPFKNILCDTSKSMEIFEYIFNEEELTLKEKEIFCYQNNYNVVHYEELNTISLKRLVSPIYRIVASVSNKIKNNYDKNIFIFTLCNDFEQQTDVLTVISKKLVKNIYFILRHLLDKEILFKKLNIIIDEREINFYVQNGCSKIVNLLKIKHNIVFPYSRELIHLNVSMYNYSDALIRLYELYSKNIQSYPELDYVEINLNQKLLFDNKKHSFHIDTEKITNLIVSALLFNLSENNIIHQFNYLYNKKIDKNLTYLYQNNLSAKNLNKKLYVLSQYPEVHNLLSNVHQNKNLKLDLTFQNNNGCNEDGYSMKQSWEISKENLDDKTIKKIIIKIKNKFLFLKELNKYTSNNKEKSH